MLKGIVKPNGEIVLLQDLDNKLRSSADRCFKAELLCGVNEKNSLIVYKDGIEIPVTVQVPGLKKKQNGNGELFEEWIKNALNLQPVDSPKRISRKQARINERSQNRP